MGETYYNFPPSCGIGGRRVTQTQPPVQVHPGGESLSFPRRHLEIGSRRLNWVLGELRSGGWRFQGRALAGGVQERGGRGEEEGHTDVAGHRISPSVAVIYRQLGDAPGFKRV